MRRTRGSSRRIRAAYVLPQGFPLQSVPLGRETTRRIHAASAFVPVQVTLARRRVQCREIASPGEGVHGVVPNVTTLHTWIEWQYKKPINSLGTRKAGPLPEVHSRGGAGEART